MLSTSHGRLPRLQVWYVHLSTSRRQIYISSNLPHPQVAIRKVICILFEFEIVMGTQIQCAVQSANLTRTPQARHASRLERSFPENIDQSHDRNPHKLNSSDVQTLLRQYTAFPRFGYCRIIGRTRVSTFDKKNHQMQPAGPPASMDLVRRDILVD